MLPTERGAFAKLIARHLGAYAKSPTPDEIGMWFDQLDDFAIVDIGRALEAHVQHPDDGKRAPRPIDVIRSLRSGSTGSEACAAVDAVHGRCQYPGVFSEGTNGGGPWYCSWHVRERGTPEAAVFIRASQEIPYAEAMARRVARMNAQAHESPTVKSLRERLKSKAAGNIGRLARKPGEDEEAA